MAVLKRKILLSLCVSCVIIAVSLLAAIPSLHAAEKGTGLIQTRLLKPGTDAPLFTLKTLDNKSYTLSDHIGKKPVLLFFWSFFCGPCREEMPILNEIYASFGEEKLEFVGVNLDGRGLLKAITRYMDESKFQFTAVLDELNGFEYLVADPYGIAGTPTVYVVDARGKIAFAAVGKIEPGELKKVIEQSM